MIVPNPKGGAQHISTGSAFALNPRAGVFAFIELSSGADGTLPDARTFFQPGAKVMAAMNDGPGTLTVKDNAGNTLASVSSGNTAVLHLLDNSTLAGTWVAEVRSNY